MRWVLVSWFFWVFGLTLAQKPQVLIGTGGVGGVYFYYGTTIAEILNKAGVAMYTSKPP